MMQKNARAYAVALAVAAPLALTLAPRAAHAQTFVQSQPSGVLSLNAQASAQVPQDVVDITLFYEQEATDPSALTATLNQRADAALREARGTSDVSARTGAFSIYPTNDRDGHLTGWRGRTEVVLESHDFAAASKLAGQMSSVMQVGSVQFSLSPQAQRAAEQKLTSEAIASFRQQAGAAAEAFGYSVTSRSI
jgi:predicted secreted protein